MTCLLPDEGHKVVSVDLVSAEPTVTCHFSRDPMYRYACFDGVGKTPHFKAFKQYNVLMLDDIYLMTMSISPFGADKMREAFHTKYNGLTFQEQWLKDPEYIQKVVLKKERALHKIMALGLAYSMGPAKLVKQAYTNGYTINKSQATQFFNAYWTLFERVRSLGLWLEQDYKKRGYITNPFGYRLVPHHKESYKCLNYFIQSSISGMMHVICDKFFTVTPYAQMKTVIHDEIVMDIPSDKLDDARALMNKSVEHMNNELKWSVPVRTGWAVGDEWYSAK